MISTPIKTRKNKKPSDSTLKHMTQSQLIMLHMAFTTFDSAYSCGCFKPLDRKREAAIVVEKLKEGRWSLR